MKNPYADLHELIHNRLAEAVKENHTAEDLQLVVYQEFLNDKLHRIRQSIQNAQTIVDVRTLLSDVTSVCHGYREYDLNFQDAEWIREEIRKFATDNNIVVLTAQQGNK